MIFAIFTTPHNDDLICLSPSNYNLHLILQCYHCKIGFREYGKYVLLYMMRGGKNRSSERIRFSLFAKLFYIMKGYFAMRVAFM